MKRLLLIISPYLIFCSLFSLLFIFRPSKIKEKTEDNNNVDTTKVVTPSTDTTIMQETIDSLENVDSVLDDQLSQLQEDAFYKLVVGSFKSELKAQQLSDNLSSEGYTVKIIRIENVLRVCVGFSNSKEELNDIKSDLESKGYKPWISKNV
jgi:cell division septation protein DedD